MFPFLLIAVAAALLVAAVTFAAPLRRGFARRRELRRCLRRGWWESLLADLNAYERQLAEQSENRHPSSKSRKRE
jgi:hypothetical protein